MLNRDLLKDAIKRKRQVQFVYDFSTRVVGPYRLGILNNNDVLAIRAIEDKKPLKIFHVNKISNLEILDTTFETPEKYKKGDKAFKTIIIEIEEE